MAQVKKPEVRDAILAAAFNLFSEHGYHNTTMAKIAATSNVSTANVYVYFGSKLDILYAIYEPWFRLRLARLEKDLKRLRSPRKRMFKLLHALWCEIPAEDNGFANNFVQAISAAGPDEGYRPALLCWAEERITDLLCQSLPPERWDDVRRSRVAHALLMAFDGYVIGRHLNPRTECHHDTITLFVSFLIGNDPEFDDDGTSSGDPG